MLDFFIFIADEDNLDYCCIAKTPKGMNAIHRPVEGIRMGDLYSKALDFQMSPRYGGKVVPDCVSSLFRYMIVSDKLRNIFKLHGNAEIEFLPINIIDHKGIKINDEYFIANIIDTVDCVDLTNSEYVIHPMDTEQFQYVSKLELDRTRISENMNLFRTKHIPKLIIIRYDLMQIIKSNNITGCSFLPLGEQIDL